MRKNVFALVLATFAAVLLLAGGTQGTPPGTPSHPEGARGIVFCTARCVWYLPAGSSVPIKLGNGESAVQSPDGRSAAFFQPDAAGDKGTVKMVPLSGGGARIIGPFPSFAPYMAWAEDKIVLVGGAQGGKRGLWSYPVAGGPPALLLELGLKGGPGDAWGLAWSPKERALVFHDMSDLYFLGLDGKKGGKLPLKNIVGSDGDVASSDSFVPNPADPNLLAYTCQVMPTPAFDKAFGEPNTALFLWNRKTGARKRLTPPDVLALDPAWSADGKTVLFAGYREPNYKEENPFRICRVSPDGTGLAEILRGERPSP